MPVVIPAAGLRGDGYGDGGDAYAHVQDRLWFVARLLVALHDDRPAHSPARRLGVVRALCRVLAAVRVLVLGVVTHLPPGQLPSRQAWQGVFLCGLRVPSLGRRRGGR